MARAIRNRVSAAVPAMVAALVAAATARAQTAAPAAPIAPEPAAAGEGAAPTPTVSAEALPTARTVFYGGALRARWISVPSWLLGLFTKLNVPLSAYSLGGEFFRRKGDLDLSLSISWQRLSPPDGNWLGKSKPADQETDYLQFRGLGAVSFDASFIWRTALSEIVDLRYGAGLGLAIVTGKLYRTSAGGCTPQNAANEKECFPRVPGCNGAGFVGPCPDQPLKASQGQVDHGPGDPHRFVEDDVPGAVPVINVLLGLGFRIPNVKGLELRVDGGYFFPAFFLGGGTAYVF